MATILHVDTVLTTDGFRLDPLTFSVQFSGSVKVESLPANIPVTVFVRLPDQFNNEIHPLIVKEEDSPDSDSDSEAFPLSDDAPVAMQTLSQDQFPFLPLAPDFNPQDGEAWRGLANSIESWLVQGPCHFEDGASYLVRELFWMAFVAAFPSFPVGDWPNWDPRIPMEGNFISDWLHDFELSAFVQRDEFAQSARRIVWDELTAAITFFFTPISSGNHQ